MQILWDTLSGELQTTPQFHDLGIEQPRGPSFINDLALEYQDYAELHHALANLTHRRKLRDEGKPVPNRSIWGSFIRASKFMGFLIELPI